MSDSALRRILMTADTIGGVWTYALELCRALGRHNVEIVLATLGRPLRPDQAAAVAALSNVACCESRFRLEWMDEPWDDVARAGEWLLGLENYFRPDVIHLNGYAHGALPWRAPVLIAGHSCVLSWWRAVRGGEAPACWQRYHESVFAGLRAADCVVAPSAAMLAALNEHYGPLVNPRIIYNARDPADFPPQPKEPFVLCVGRLWDDAKNAAALVRAAPALPWPVRLAGETAVTPVAAGVPACRSKPDDIETDTRLSAPVEFLGSLPQPELAALYGRASIFALPARYEPFGLSALEAALAGCALVLGDIPSLREVWRDAAWFVSSDDERALVAAISELARNAARRERLAQRARERATLYRPERMARAYLAAYANATAARAAASRDAAVSEPAHALA